MPCAGQKPVQRVSLEHRHRAVRQKLDVIATYGGAAPHEKKQRRLFPAALQSRSLLRLAAAWSRALSRPGGSVTGWSLQPADTPTIGSTLLREVVPSPHRLAIMDDADYPATIPELGNELTSHATSASHVVRHGIKRAEDIGPDLEAAKGQTDALYIVENGRDGDNGAGLEAFASS